MISIRETKDETEFESTLNPNQYDRYDKPDSAMTKKKKKERKKKKRRRKPDESNQHTMFSMLTFEEKVSINHIKTIWEPSKGMEYNTCAYKWW